jgi:anti-sigma factor ChrR (cupin superfamily)
MLLNRVNINDNYDQSVSISINDIKPFVQKELGYTERVLSFDGHRKTVILELNNKSKFANISEFQAVEIFVLEGVYSNEFGDFGKGTYLNLPLENQEKVFCHNNCKVFKKSNYEGTKEQIIIDTNKEEWLEGYGNLTVMPLSDNTALVNWPKDEKFIEHKHWGGEEIFVLSGIFMDEYGVFPKDTWIRNHHLSSHIPFVQEETMIFVKTGHLPE